MELNLFIEALTWCAKGLSVSFDQCHGIGKIVLKYVRFRRLKLSSLVNHCSSVGNS